MMMMMMMMMEAGRRASIVFHGSRRRGRFIIKVGALIAFSSSTTGDMACAPGSRSDHRM
jgi:hypothetical protein